MIMHLLFVLYENNVIRQFNNYNNSHSKSYVN